jgi:hypothetical protein
MMKANWTGGKYMFEQLISSAKSEGLWALLFVVLLAWVLQQNDRREKRYQDIIDKLSTEFISIKEGLKDLGNKIESFIGKRRE